jgi:hypothetical protein
MAPHLVHQFWGSNSDSVSQLLVREVILAEQVEVLPGNRRAMGHRVEKRLPAGGILEALVLPGTDVPSTGSCVSKLSRRARTS